MEAYPHRNPVLCGLLVGDEVEGQGVRWSELGALLWWCSDWQFQVT